MFFGILYLSPLPKIRCKCLPWLSVQALYHRCVAALAGVSPEHGEILDGETLVVFLFVCFSVRRSPSCGFWGVFFLVFEAYCKDRDTAAVFSSRQVGGDIVINLKTIQVG